MKNIFLKLGIAALLILMSTSEILPQQGATEANVQSDSLKVLEQYSLFAEYYKNRDFQSAVPYGWNVIKMNPKKFSQWIFFKMEDALWYLHDSAKVSESEKSVIADTIRHFYNLAIEYDPASKGYFEARKAFVSESWLKMKPDSLIKEYELAIKDDSTISSYYYNQLGTLYKNNATDQNNYKEKALDLYTYLSQREPNNPQWPSELEGLVDNIKELVALRKKAWDFDKNNLAKAWDYALTALRAQMYDQAIGALEFLQSKSPDNVTYLTQLASAYQKIDKLDKAEDTYKKLIQLKPDNKDFYLNLGIVYKDKGKLPQARTEFLKANDVAKGWGLAILYEGFLYEQAARGCEFNFETKLVYLLAVETYKKALNVDPTLAQAKERIAALGTSIPTKEDYFFRGYKSGQSLPITGSCYGWIGRSVTVP